MPSIHFQASALAMLARVGLASDDERTSATLAGVLVSIRPEGALTFAATDGKILAEHRLTSIHPEGWPIDPVDLVLPWRGDKFLASWVREQVKIAAKGKPTDLVSLSWEGRDVTLSHKGATYKTKSVDAVFPSYRNALDQSAAMPGNVALAGCYLSRMHEILNGGKDASSGVRIRKGRGWVFERLAGGDDTRVLIMPLSIPEGQSVSMVEVHPERLKELEGYEATVRAGQVATNPDPAILAENEKLRARIAELEAKTMDLADKVAQAKDKTPKPVPCAVVKWRPVSQTEQLRGAGLKVADLKAAGFVWKMFEWVGETEACAALKKRIEAVKV